MLKNREPFADDPACATALVAGVRVLPDGTHNPVQQYLMVEHCLAVQYNGSVWKQICCTPTALQALVLGRLCTEGVLVLPTGAPLPQITLSADAAVATVASATPLVQPVAIEVLLQQRSAAAQQEKPPLLPAQVFALMAGLAAEYPLYHKTHGCHSVTLLRHGAVLQICEDLSRHNALDKGIGWALQQGIPLAECVVYSSGRAPYDMIQKAVRAGVGAYISKAVPTQQGLALAKAANLPIICMAKGGSYTLF